MKDIDLKQLKTIALNAAAFAQKYAAFICIVGILLIYTFLVLRINVLTSAKPSEEAIAEKANTVKRLKIDEESMTKIQNLQDQNIGVQSLFETARDNPFQD